MEASAAQRAEYDQRANIANIGQKRSVPEAEVGRDRQIDKRQRDSHAEAEKETETETHRDREREKERQRLQTVRERW